MGYQYHHEKILRTLSLPLNDFLGRSTPLLFDKRSRLYREVLKGALATTNPEWINVRMI